MAKHNDRYNVNFHNPKTRQIINYLQLAENRMSRQEFLSIGNNDILYKLKHSGYIKETSKGSFQGTKKLRDKVARETGHQFGKGSSCQHSQKLLKVAECIPHEVIIHRDFKTGTEIEKQFYQFKQSNEYKERTEYVRQEYSKRIDSLKEHHASIQASAVSQRDKLQENINYQHTLSVLKRELNIIEEERYSAPDFSFTCYKAQSLEFLSNLNKEMNSVSCRGHIMKYQMSATNTIMKQIMEESLTDTITWTIEIITEHYGTEDLKRHYQYDKITDTKTIYI